MGRTVKSSGSTNRKEFADKNGMCLPNFGIGANYLDHCGSATSRGIAKDLKELLSGRRDLVTTIYPCHSPKQQRWFFLIGLALATERRSGIAILHVDLTKFLPIPIGGRALRAKPSQAPTIAASGILEAIANTVETSVSDNLASQLNAMLGAAAPPTRKAQAKDGDCDQISRARLSKRQLEVLKLLGEGRTNAEIARTFLGRPILLSFTCRRFCTDLNSRAGHRRRCSLQRCRARRATANHICAAPIPGKPFSQDQLLEAVLQLVCLPAAGMRLHSHAHTEGEGS